MYSLVVVAPRGLPSPIVDDGIDQGHEHVDIGYFGGLNRFPPEPIVTLLLDGNEALIDLYLFDLMPWKQLFPVAHPLLIQTDLTEVHGLACLIGSDEARQLQARGFPRDGVPQRFDVV